MKRFGALLTLVLAVGSFGCDARNDQAAPGPAGASPPSAAPGASGPVSAVPLAASARSTTPTALAAAAPAPKAAAPDPIALRRARFERYASWFAEADQPDCKQYGVILSVIWPSQPSRHVWLADLLRAEPELNELVTEGSSLRLLRPVYGPRNYGRGVDVSDLSREALVVECEDHLLCRAFAGFYGHVDPFARPKSYCGQMPGRSGGDMPLRLDALLARPRSFPHGVCARYRACLAVTHQPAASCDGFEKSAAACAELPDCDAALACFGKETRNPNKPLWSDGPRSGHSGIGVPGGLGF